MNFVKLLHQINIPFNSIFHLLISALESGVGDERSCHGRPSLREKDIKNTADRHIFEIRGSGTEESECKGSEAWLEYPRKGREVSRTMQRKRQWREHEVRE